TLAELGGELEQLAHDVERARHRHRRLMLEKSASPVEPVPVRDGIERKQERIVVHALRAEHIRATAIESIEGANSVGIEQKPRRIERRSKTRRAVHVE